MNDYQLTKLRAQRAILKEIAVENGVRAVVLESHKNWIDKDPLRSMEVSAEWFAGRFGS